MDKSEFWKKVRKVAINKFAITLYVFAIVFVFIGDQSLINQISRAIEMRSIRKKIAQEQAETARAINVLESLNDTDSLERFAREQYYMHTDNEIVYIVE
jgi:cell division protein FtsB